jgi:hypothetical protein
MRRTRLAAVLLSGALAVAGCTSTVAGTPKAGGAGGGDRALVVAYFKGLNTAAEQGPSAQREFLAETQHPDYTNLLCDLGDFTLSIEPAMTTFRPDENWAPDPGDDPPRGDIYVLGVSVTIRQEGAVLAEQIGSQRVVVLDGKAYGFAPCPTGR